MKEGNGANVPSRQYQTVHYKHSHKGPPLLFDPFASVDEPMK
jgi:hypothetical protein